MERSRGWFHVATLLAVGAVYFAAARLGLALAVVHPSASPVWPATGIALAAALLLGRRVWPAIFAGAYLVNAITASGPWASLGIAAGNTLEAVAGALLVERFANGARALERSRDVFAFVVLAGLLAPVISATIGVTSLALAGGLGPSPYGSTWLTWWLGDVGGALVVAPALIAWTSRDPFACGRAELVEAAVFLTLLFGVGAYVFVVTLEPLRFLCLPLVIWAAFRYGHRGTAVAVLTLSAFAAWGTLRNVGVSPGEAEHRALLVLQLFLGVASVTGLMLAAVVGERRRALEELERQASELERSNAELASFAHVISHDLKAPLRGISSLAAWIVEDNKDQLPDESADHLRLLEKRTKRMSQLIDGVLAYSRVARARRTPERVDAGAVVTEVVDSLGPTKQTIRIEGPLPGVRYDRTQLAQVFQNLIANAVQHMGRPDGEIVVSCRQRSEAWEFSVRDDGVGIDEAHAERIFRMFHSLQPEGETTGVGLTLVKKIVEAHGGTIRVEPTPSGGATFRFSVPKQPRDRSRGRE